MARRRSSRFIWPASRTKMWIGAGIGTDNLLASALTFVSSLSGGALLLRPFTVLRTHLLVHFTSDQVAVNETPFGTLARIVVTETAAALGVTAMPDPSPVSGDPEAAWFAVQNCSLRFKFLDATGVFDAGVHFVVDDHAMRKVGPDDDIATIFSMDAGVGADMITQGRMLIQLH